MPRASLLAALASLTALALAAACGTTPVAPALDAAPPDASDAAGGPTDAAASTDAADATDAAPRPDASDSAAPFDAGLGAPITAPPGVWTWVDFPDAKCDDGSSTGVGVNLAPGATKSLVFLNGGGACADYSTCYVLNTATHGPFGAAQLASLTGALSGSALDRDDAQNPFRDYNLVVVPYCTGDLHAGSNVATYTGDGTMRTYHHVGRDNMIAYLKRLTPTFSATTELVLAGASAGGFGATLNHDLVRRYFPSVILSVIDDSGPLFVGDAVPPALRAAWGSAWRLDATLGALCPACAGDLSALYGVLAAKYPNDRSALLSSLGDSTMRTYLFKDAAQYEASVRELAGALAPRPQYRTFLVPGASHTMLGRPASFTSGGVELRAWLTQMVTRDPAWASQAPP